MSTFLLQVFRSHRLALDLLPLLAITWIVFMVTGLAMPVLPLHVSRGLDMNMVVVGCISGAQFAAALVSRIWAGRVADSRGPKYAVTMGIVIAAAAGVLYLLSLLFMATPALSAVILLAGRALLGGAESMVITGAQSWGLALAGEGNTGKAIAWIGMAMYVALAIGAPFGTVLYARYGFAAVALATSVLPLLALLLVAQLRPVAPSTQAPASLASVISAIWLPGAGLALASLGFGAVTTFVSLLYASHGWHGTWLAFSVFSVAFLAARLFFGHLPDQLGGARLAAACLLLEAAGQTLIWLAASPAFVVLGAILTGFGYSLVYPAFGLEAVRSAPSASRGMAMGAYTAFLDLTLGVTGPALGWVGSSNGISSVFLVSALIVLCATVVAVQLPRRDGALEKTRSAMRHPSL